MKKILFCFFIFLFEFNGIAQTSDFVQIDSHARNTSNVNSRSVESLTNYLVIPAKNDLEKVRSFYVWITDNIAYDTKAFFSGSVEQYTPDQVLKRRLAVCQGYSVLLKEMCDLQKIPCEIIAGYSKGFGYNPGRKLDNTDHAWNAVKIDNNWYLIDATWGSGYLNEKNRFEKHFSNEYFLSNPRTFVYKHLPADPMWQLLDNPVTLKVFQKDSNMIESYLNTTEKYFSYNDSIETVMNLDDFEKQIKSSLNEFNFNNKLTAPVGYAYMNKAYFLFKELLENKNIKSKEALEKQENILKIYEKALYYFEINNDQNSIQARHICKDNIKSCKDNLKVYQQRIERGM